MSWRVLLTGGTGQLGRELLSLDWDGEWTLDAPGRAELDLGDPQALLARARDGGYAAVINAGAWTAVDAAEDDPIPVWQANAVAPAALAAGCRASGIPLVQISTDYVFDGTGNCAWSPSDPIAPVSVYGASKAGGELAVRASGARYAILRTAWVVSAHGRNFVTTMLRLATEHDEIAVVADQFGSPTAAADLADAVARVTQAFVADSARLSGIWHVANAGRASWRELAEHVFARCGSGEGRRPRVMPIATADYPTAAARPANSQLDTASLATDFGIRLPHWRDAVDRVLDELTAKEPT